jgi:hypothetical protein
VKTAKQLKVTPPPAPLPASASGEDNMSQSVTDNNNSNGPPTKKSKLATSVFASYQQAVTDSASAAQIVETVESLIDKYIEYISNGRCAWKDVPQFKYYSNLWPLLEYIFCVPATSAPVERIFSQGGLFVRPHRARLSDRLLCQLMFVKCNDKLSNSN